MREGKEEGGDGFVQGRDSDEGCSADDGDASWWVASIGDTGQWVALVRDGSVRWVWEMDCER